MLGLFCVLCSKVKWPSASGDIGSKERCQNSDQLDTFGAVPIFSSLLMKVAYDEWVRLQWSL